MQRLCWNKLSGKQGLFHVAVTRLEEGTQTFPHTHDFYEMFLVLKGSGTHRRNRNTIPLHPGLLVFVEPDDGHSFSTSPDETLEFVNLAAARAWLGHLEKVADLPKNWWRAGQPRGHVPMGTEAARELHRLIFRLMEPHPEPEALATAWIRAAHAAVHPAPSRKIPPAWLSALHRDLQNPVLLTEPIGYWQKRAGRSAEHLARSCRRFYGAPLNELINRARISRVQFLLQTTDEKVTTVAFSAGYNNLAHFYRVFERLTGETPHSWRRRAAARLVPGSEA
jgi:AraC family cel operon transcriptional repressor